VVKIFEFAFDRAGPTDIIQKIMTVQPPKMAYIILWFPLPSETFIFREVVNLWKKGLPLKVFTLYGETGKWLSPEMESVSDRMERLGIPGLRKFPGALYYWFRRKPEVAAALFREIPVRRWRSLEVAGENIWAFFAGFHLARRFEEEGIELIHSPWANGPATAAWVASRLAGIPFGFTGRAVDIYPPDGALAEKMRDAVFVRTNTATNVEYLKQFAGGAEDKIHLTYNGYPIAAFREAAVAMKPPYKLLAVGRFARFKGYEYLLRAMSILKKNGFDFQLTLVGDGWRRNQFKVMCRLFGIEDRVSFPGFVTHDKVSDYYYQSDMFLMPSVVHKTGERDGIPNVIMEALLHRLPVIATNVSALGEIIIGNETGLVVPPRDAKALAEKIMEMAGDREKALHLAENGRARVLKQFDPEANHQRVFDLYVEQFEKFRAGDSDRLSKR
jgi:colanic acid/amylovoran biosynthesis glycosyltransferase